MRFTAFLLIVSLGTACKTTRSNRPAEFTLDSIENEEQLPACDDITVGRVYWVRSLNRQVSCAEGGTWKPREVEADGKDNPAFGPRNIP